MTTLPKWLVSFAAVALAASAPVFRAPLVSAQQTQEEPPILESTWQTNSGTFSTPMEACRAVAVSLSAVYREITADSVTGIAVYRENPNGFPLAISCIIPPALTSSDGPHGISCHPHPGYSSNYLYIGDLDEGVCVHLRSVRDFLQRYHADYVDETLGGKEPPDDHDLCDRLKNRKLKIGCKAATWVFDQRTSRHAEERGQQGRPVGRMPEDVRNARPSDVYVQPDGLYVVRGPGGREHILSPSGKHVTTVPHRSKQAHSELVRNGERTPVTYSQYDKFMEMMGKLWNF